MLLQMKGELKWGMSRGKVGRKGWSNLLVLIAGCAVFCHRKWTSEFISDELQGPRNRSGGGEWENNNVINDVKFITDYLHKLHA